MKFISNFPGEAILWPLMLLIMWIWGRHQEKKKVGKMIKKDKKR